MSRKGIHRPGQPLAVPWGDENNNISERGTQEKIRTPRALHENSVRAGLAYPANVLAITAILQMPLL